MQQLLGDMEPWVDATILRQLFLQRPLSNVQLTLTPLAGALNLGQLADRGISPYYFHLREVGQWVTLIIQAELPQ